MTSSKSLWDEHFIQNLKEEFLRRYGAHLKKESFSFSSSESEENLQLTVTLARTDGTMNYPVEALFLFEENTLHSHSPTELKIKVSLEIADYIGTYFEEFFRSERDVYLPIDWSKHTWNDQIFYLRGQITNPILEEAADQFLIKHGVNLQDLKELPLENCD